MYSWSCSSWLQCGGSPPPPMPPPPPPPPSQGGGSNLVNWANMRCSGATPWGTWFETNSGGDCANFVTRALSAGACLPYCDKKLSGQQDTSNLWYFNPVTCGGKTYNLVATHRPTNTDGGGLYEFLDSLDGWNDVGTSVGNIRAGCVVCSA